MLRHLADLKEAPLVSLDAPLTPTSFPRVYESNDRQGRPLKSNEGTTRVGDFFCYSIATNRRDKRKRSDLTMP